MADRKSVLIVDDAPTMRTTLRSIFARRGYQVVGEASNGLQAIQRFEEFRPDLVTMDIGMPELGGLEAICGIRKIDPSAKVIVCSGQNTKDIVVQAFRLGILDFVVKPFDAERLLEAVAKAA